MQMKKEIVFWGTGNICRTCLEWNKNIQPIFFIDSYNVNNQFYGKPIYRPEDINNWAKYTIIIMVMHDYDIKQYLTRRGLNENVDFFSYGNYFAKDLNIIESIEEVKNFIFEYPMYKNSIFIYAPVLNCRNNSMMTNFFRKYSIAREPEKCLLHTVIDVTSRKNATNVLGIEFIAQPSVCQFDCKKGIADKQYEIYREFEVDLTEEEKSWIKDDLETRKVKRNDYKDLHLSFVLYYYAKEIIRILEPNKIVIWGGWERYCYILAHIAKERGIPYGFMEYGWIPGTVQFNPSGIAGQSTIFMGENCENGLIEEKKLYVDKIKDYVKKTQIDSGFFHEDIKDKIQLNKINKKRKTLFFIGMADEGIQIDSTSDYWTQYVSEVVKSTHEAVWLCYQLAKKNKWNFIFKPHPGLDNYEEYEKWSQGEDFILVRHTGVDSLIMMADVAISIASAVDYKVVIYGKPLVEIGHGALQKQNCTYYVKNKNEIEKLLNEAVNNGFTKKQEKALDTHLLYLLEHHLWDDLSNRELRYGLSVEKDFFE